MSFTGYLLPWDQKAYFATTVGSNILTYSPVIGAPFKSLLLGGAEMCTISLSRFFVVHVFLLPSLILGFIAAHVLLFRRAGPAGPFQGDPQALKRSTEPFYPKQVVFDLLFALVIIGWLGLLAHYLAVAIAPRANASDTHYVLRPEW